MKLEELRQRLRATKQPATDPKPPKRLEGAPDGLREWYTRPVASSDHQPKRVGDMSYLTPCAKCGCAIRVDPLVYIPSTCAKCESHL